jgi:hypothetical protein
MMRPTWLVALGLLACTKPEPRVFVALSRLPASLPSLVNMVHESQDAPAYRIAATPDLLQVYRSTEVALSVEGTPSPVRCRWRFGDGTPEAEGCALSHTFIGGTADERVTLVVDTDSGAQTTTRILPLERLPVTAPRSTDDLAIPPAPEGPTSFRVVLLADTAGGDLGALAPQIIALRAALVIHVGGVASPEDPANGWATLRDKLAEPLRGQGIALLIAPSPGDLEADAEIRRPLGPDGDALDLLAGDDFPERWALSFRGVHFTFISGSDLEATPRGRESTLAWLKARLGEAQIYESRIVISHLPLHPFGDRRPADPGTLVPKFKAYEVLLRARATALVSAGHAVYFKGRYGALPVLSVGSPVTAGKLLGVDAPATPTLAVMDIVDGVPTRIFALEGKDFAQILDESYLPETVEVYTR